MNPLFASQPLSIFAHMTTLADAHGAVNLGQGFPDFGWPEDVVERAADALRTGSNQYAPMRGLPQLREAICAHYRHHQRLDLAPDQVTVTSGATEAIAATLMALIAPGDEVVMFQPLYDAYVPMVERAGGTARFVSLGPPDWRITPEALAEAFTDRTRLMVFNNPHNPTARMFDAEEMRLLAEACVAHDVRVLSDEVWEHLVFDGRRHTALSSLPGMAERTVKIGSAGKIFSLTGWKTGWAIAPPELASAIAAAHQYLTFATPPNLQSAVAYGLGKEDAYFDGMRSGFQDARDYLVAALGEAGFAVLPAEGTYFLNIDLAASGIEADDLAFAERAVAQAGVAVIPVSPFYAEEAVTTVVRLCFAKQRETLDRGIEALGKARALF